MSNNDVKNNDAGNRGMIEVKGKKSPKKLLILIALAVLALFIAVLVAKILPGKEVKQTGMEPKNEALVNNSVESDQITGFMKNIKDKEERDRKEREAREAREKEAKAKAEREQAGGNENAGAVNAVTAGSGSTRSVEQGGDDKDKPLPKPLRQLTGDTMVAMDNGKQQDSAPEKDALQGGSYADGSVSPVMKRRYLLSAGTSLSCVLKTKIVTSYPGVTLCQLTKDVYSDNGETLLARKGAMLQGEQNKVMTQGVARVFVIWTNLKDGNINARIDALGTDSLGASGLPAWVDSHFWERFGGALMLSLVGDGLDILKSSTQSSGSNSNVTYDNTSDATKEMAKTTLENTINIPPTAYINQGTVLSVIVPRNIDFSSVYEVR
ncbi:conjugal transfer protein TraI [Escherichia coli]|jgi:type IV secretion system protein VirB10|uniref:TrbI/VirB10 family protein n=1 Tax=Citrobacter sp. Cf115 TaxID=2985066 RepID=UPI001270F9AF|nr:TrbI/VirB10 family protein [Citrobacter sp. Cf115]EAT0039939.1 conjugal transfer protein TraI [Salmonella enterica]EFI4645240.1 conjugal transfer protein TraI [Escherichia coli]EHG0088597.1 conjugal transfer protein TraI [Salmonella enterica subsp. enterica serovar Newport]HCB1507556.1 conjugal transfer protein TraI [Citrobacter freundii]EBA4851851.1 conjugal transfer protein TraI [Salmonella enterica]